MISIPLVPKSCFKCDDLVLNISGYNHITINRSSVFSHREFCVKRCSCKSVVKTHSIDLLGAFGVLAAAISGEELYVMDLFASST